MSTKKRGLISGIFIFVILLAISSRESQSSLASGDINLMGQKIEPLVINQILADGSTEVFVWMNEKANLSSALTLKSKVEKGRFVFESLKGTASRSQEQLLKYIEAEGFRYKSYFIANKILIYGATESLLNSLTLRADVEKITANHVFQLDEPIISPNVVDEPTGIESNIDFINAPDVWALGITGTGIVLAGNDTGLDWDHPALINQYRGWNGFAVDHNYNWWDSTGTYPTVPGDGHGHGTHTSGTMVGDDGGSNQIGMAPDAILLHCKNMTNTGSGSDATFTECFEWDLAPWDLNGQNPKPELAPDAINNSWGYWGGGSPQFEDEIAALQAAGIVVEVSAGNEGSRCSTLRSPGDYRDVITTGSVQHNSGNLPGTITGFSSRGPSSLYPGDFIPDIMAPGENIRSSIPGGGFQGGWSGTSMSGPHITGLIALLWEAAPVLKGDVAGTYQVIYDTAVPLIGQTGSNCGGNYTTGPNNDWGFGSMDALASVEAAMGLGATIEGRLRLQGRSDHSGAEVCAVDILAAQVCTLSDAGGYYSMPVATGFFDITVEASLFLDAVHFGIEDGTILPNLRLLGGDANDDDCIKMQDISYIHSKRGTFDGGPGWDVRADINGDGLVDNTDVRTANRNRGSCSPLPWP